MAKRIINKILRRELKSKDLIFPFLRGLTQREKDVLLLRKKGIKLESIGKKMGGISRERVRQIQRTAKNKIAFQDRIVEKLTEKLGESLFCEREIEKVFLSWFKYKFGETLAKRKMVWQIFCRRLWRLKKE